MPDGRHEGGWRTPAALVAGGAYALAAAATTAFTGPADVIAALPIAGLALAVVVRWPRRPQPLVPPGKAAGHPFRAWVVLLGAIVVWELAQYLARGSRGAHPTLSSMADALDRFYLLKALVLFGWLCLGAGIVIRGTPAGPTGSEPVTPP